MEQLVISSQWSTFVCQSVLGAGSLRIETLCSSFSFLYLSFSLFPQGSAEPVEKWRTFPFLVPVRCSHLNTGGFMGGGAVSQRSSAALHS